LDRERLGRRARACSHWCRCRRLRRSRELSAVGAYLANHLRARNRRKTLRERSGHHCATGVRRTRYCTHGMRRTRNRAPVLWRTRYCTEGLPRARERATVLRRTRNCALEWLRTEAQEWRRTGRGRAHGLKERGRREALRRHRENCLEGREAGSPRSSSKRRSKCLRRGTLSRVEKCIRVHRWITSLFPRVGNDR